MIGPRPDTRKRVFKVFETPSENARYVSRLDVDELLGTVSNHPFQLEDRIWPTVEHYIQAMQFDEEPRQEKIRMAKTAMLARKFGKTGLFRRANADRANRRQVYMTRALYTKCRTYPVVREALLATGDEFIVENDQYDYYWGCGRDRRGDNNYGKVLMQVRQKLLDEADG